MRLPFPARNRAFSTAALCVFCVAESPLNTAMVAVLNLELRTPVPDQSLVQSI
jgi:hypothetical protein